MKEIVWVFGNGAAGKATFINFILGPQSAGLRQRLGWQHKKIFACQESLQWLGQNPKDPIISNRSKIPAIAVRLAQKSDVILIKGQDIDLQEYRPETVRAQLHDARHKVIFISTDLDELMDRRSKKAWWNGTDTREDTKALLDYQLAMLAPLKKDMDFIVIDGSLGKDYAFI